MVIDKLVNFKNYVTLNPLFSQAYDFIESTDLNNLDLGKFVLKENDIMINCELVYPKTKQEAKFETHNKFIDIQIPLTASEIIGYSPRADLLEEPYDAKKDITFYNGAIQQYITVHPGMFAIFFPDDAHAPGISSIGLKKVVIKINTH